MLSRIKSNPHLGGYVGLSDDSIPEVVFWF